MPRPAARLPRLVSAAFHAMLPLAERDEVIADLQQEFAQREAAFGRTSARRWAWRQALGSVPALSRRTWWRGMTGFEPRASRMRPGGPMLESWIMDFRYAARRLMRRRTYAGLAVLTLALGAGGTAAVYSVVGALLLDPLPIARESEDGVLWFDGSWTEQEFLTLQPDFPGFQKMAAYRPDDLTLEVAGAPLRLVPGMAVSHELFDVLGAPPALGRTFRPGEDLEGAEQVVVLSHGLWQDLGADPAIVGKRLQLGGAARTVVGVMPRGFWFPSPKTRIWSAAQMTPRSRSGRYTLIGRAADGVQITAMQGQLDALGRMLGERYRYPEQWDKTKAPAVTPARESFVGDVRPSLVATLAAMGVILLIACANVAALMLGQVDARSTELAVRAALGANRQRLVQQLLLEALLIGLLAGIAGAALASAGFTLLVESLPLGALAANARLDWTVFTASMLAALGAALLIAIVPGIAMWRGSTLRATMATTRTGGVSGRGGRLEGGLVIAQMAAAVLLASGAGLMIRSVANLRAIDPGFTTDGAVIADVTMPVDLGHPERRRVILDALASLQGIPGVQAVAATQKVPLRGSGDNWGIEVVGQPEAGGTTGFRIVTRGYFDAMGMSIRRGRNFDASDREGSDPVVIVNEALAAKYFGAADPIGHLINTGFDVPERIVGVVSNAAEAELTDGPEPARYMLYEHVPITSPEASFVVRTASEALAPALVQPVRAAIEREGTRLAVQEITTLGTVFDLAVGPAGQIVTLLSLLAGLALVLGAVGVYGVISHYVTRRARDYGIHLALGQTPGRVIRQIVSRGAGLVAIGSAIGAAAALYLTRVLATLLYGIEATDPLSMIGAVGVLLAVGVVAAYVPARRASRTDPAMVLRES
jgi:predicted permease